MLKKFSPPQSVKAMTALLVVLAHTIWLITMYCITSITEEYAAERYMERNENRASSIVSMYLERRYGREYTGQNVEDMFFWEAIRVGEYGGASSSISGKKERIIRTGTADETISATAIYDADGNCIENSWSDFFFFEYLTEEQWANNEERSSNYAKAYFNRRYLADAGRELVQSGSLMGTDARAMRFTGTFDGLEFVPTKIEYIDGGAFMDELFARGDGSYTVSEIVNSSDLTWLTVYENPGAVPMNAEVITLYADWFDACYSQDSPGFSYEGKAYTGVQELLAEVGPSFASEDRRMTRWDGPVLLIFSQTYCYSRDGEVEYTSLYPGNVPGAEVHYYILSAVYCSPRQTAFNELGRIYFWTFLLMATLVLIVRTVFKKQLVEPIEIVGKVLLHDERQWLNKYALTGWRWKENQELQHGVLKNEDQQRKYKNEITRLNTALDYAKAAEENRRQMVSNIAHELKTPLAVVHSYAEGLKEQIAEEKRDKYLDVILSESERMDSMVLEMLDLSRLEAGKVKLARDEVSLSAITSTTFEKLEMAIQAKNLQVEFYMIKDRVITADEVRISQVIENFATNAIKYTPVGGCIMVRITSGPSATKFAIENDSPHLSVDELSKVWDTFYRTDNSRSGEGTGLGLAISKSIVELHGGKCEVHNTQRGVEFSFTI